MHRPVLVTGAPRSGTSWLGGVLGASPRTRYVYEPLNFQWSPELEGELSHFEYLRADSVAAPGLARRAGKAFAGRQTRKQVMRAIYRGYWQSVFRGYDRVVVKDPTAVLMADWVAASLGARVLVIVRHPCGVISSLDSLGWELSTRRLLGQPELMSDHLAPYRRLLRAARSDKWATMAAFWSAIHVVLQKQCSQNPDWITCSYEDLCIDPALQFAELGRQLDMSLDPEGQSASGGVSEADSRDPGSIRRDSIRMPDVWKERLSAGQVDTILGVVSDFGLKGFAPP